MLLIAAALLFLAAVLWAARAKKAAQAAVVAGRLGPTDDYYHDRTLRAALVFNVTNPVGWTALACTVGPDKVQGSGFCKGFCKGYVRVEDAVARMIPGGGLLKHGADKVANVLGKSYRIVKPVAEYPLVEARDKSVALARETAELAGDVGGAVKDVAESVWDNTLGRIF